MDCTIHVAKTKALINFAITAKLICDFVFACAFLLVCLCSVSFTGANGGKWRLNNFESVVVVK